MQVAPFVSQAKQNMLPRAESFIFAPCFPPCCESLSQILKTKWHHVHLQRKLKAYKKSANSTHHMAFQSHRHVRMVGRPLPHPRVPLHPPGRFGWGSWSLPIPPPHDAPPRVYPRHVLSRSVRTSNAAMLNFHRLIVSTVRRRTILVEGGPLRPLDALHGFPRSSAWVWFLSWKVLALR